MNVSTAALSGKCRYGSTWQKSLRDDQTLSALTKYVLWLLSTYADYQTGQNCFPSLETLTLKSGLSRRCVQKHLKLALASRWLLIVKTRTAGRKWAQNIYHLAYPDRGADNTHKVGEGSKSALLRGAGNDRGGGHQMPSNKIYPIKRTMDLPVSRDNGATQSLKEVLDQERYIQGFQELRKKLQARA